MKAIILCGGKGTRLGKETEHHQKCMLDVGGKPFLHYLVKKLKKAKYRIVFVVGYHGHEVIDYFNASSRWTDCMYYFSDKGQVGAINEWHRLSGEQVLFVNGDTIISGAPVKNHTLLREEDKGLYRSAGRYYPYRVDEPFNNMNEVIVNSRKLSIISGYEMIEIGTPEGLQYARNHKELLC